MTRCPCWYYRNFHDGLIAGMAGDHRDDNPNSYGTEECCAWDEGWRTSQSNRQLRDRHAAQQTPGYSVRLVEVETVEAPVGSQQTER
jgi:ribosome modulation factor